MRYQVLRPMSVAGQAYERGDSIDAATAHAWKHGVLNSLLERRRLRPDDGDATAPAKRGR